MEYTAEDLIAHKLSRYGFLVAKPKFDREGADLLALLTVGDNARFCRIQCKGRSLRSGNSNVEIPMSYATNSFVVFLYVELSEDETYLYCFLNTEIRTWHQRDGKYFLSLNKNTIKDKHSCHLFNSQRAEMIRNLIGSAEEMSEFPSVFPATLSTTLDDAQSNFSGKFEGSEKDEKGKKI